jgi:hypothetical protein
VYVDSKVLGGSPNTTPASAVSPFNAGVYSDNLWDDRPGFGLDSAGGFAGTRNVMEGGGSENLGTLTTTSAVVPYGNYRAAVWFWHSSTLSWQVNAALSGQPLQPYNAGNSVNSGVTDPSISQFTLFKGLLPGVVTGTSVAVDVDNVAAAERTWYDGFSYAPVTIGHANFDVNENDGGPISPTQPGWVGINDGGSTTTTPFAATQNGITLTVTMPSAGDFDRDRTLTNIAENVQQEDLRDFLFATTGPITADLSGLMASTLYKIRVFSYDADFNNGAITNWYVDSVSPGNLLGSITTVSTNPDGGYMDVLLTSSPTGTVKLLAGLGPSGFAYFNGLQVIPEPATASILLVGGAMLAIRRRARR